MTFFIIIATLFAERYLLEQEGFRQHVWFRDYCRWFRHLPLGEWLSESTAGILALLALPLGLLLIVQSWAAGTLGGAPEWLLGFFILLLALGPRDIEHQVTDFLDARDHGSRERASRIAADIMRRKATEPEPELSIRVSEAVVEQANDRLFGVLFWFAVLGPFGAMLYRLTSLAEYFSSQDEDRNKVHEQAFNLLHILNWVPSRLLAATYALVGNFDNVLLAWRHWSHDSRDQYASDATGLLVMTGSAALGHTPEDTMPEEAADLPPLVEDALSLVLRSLIIWVFLLGVIQIVSWLD
ncbi:MAG: regulatory signaling modulator protein AmpE [Chromatiales bacterium]|jgi:membrane protein required for beta-lactamase induction